MHTGWGPERCESFMEKPSFSPSRKVASGILRRNRNVQQFCSIALASRTLDDTHVPRPGPENLW